MSLLISRVILTGIIVIMAYFALVRVWTHKVDLISLLKKPSERIPIKDQTPTIFVSPSEITLTHQTTRNFILKIANNQDFAIFDVHLNISVNNKALELSLIKIEPIKTEAIPGVPFSMFRIDLSNGCSGIIFGSINAHSTREFNMKIEGEKIKTDSKISFAVYDWSLEPSLSDLSTKPFKKFPNNFEEFFKDKGKRIGKDCPCIFSKIQSTYKSIFSKWKGGKHNFYGYLYQVGLMTYSGPCERGGFR